MPHVKYKIVAEESKKETTVSQDSGKLSMQFDINVLCLKYM